MINKISSKESSLFKYAKKLISKSNFRKREKKFIVEGFREIQHCKNSNFTIDQIFVLEDKLQSLSIKDFKTNLITRELIQQIIYRESEGIFAIVNLPLGSITSTAPIYSSSAPRTSPVSGSTNPSPSSTIFK